MFGVAPLTHVFGGAPLTGAPLTHMVGGAPLTYMFSSAPLYPQLLSMLLDWIARLYQFSPLSSFFRPNFPLNPRPLWRGVRNIRAGQRQIQGFLGVDGYTAPRSTDSARWKFDARSPLQAASLDRGAEFWFCPNRQILALTNKAVYMTASPTNNQSVLCELF